MNDDNMTGTTDGQQVWTASFQNIQMDTPNPVGNPPLSFAGTRQEALVGLQQHILHLGIRDLQVVIEGDEVVSHMTRHQHIPPMRAWLNPPPQPE